MFSRLLSKKLNVSEIIHTSSNILISISLGVVAFGIVYSSSIMELLYPNDYTKLDTLFAITIASFPAFCIMYIFGSLLTANGNISLLIKIALLGSVMSIILNFIFIKMYKAEGAALATNLVEWTLAILYIYFSCKKIDFTINIKWVLKFIALFVILLSINVGIYSFHIALIGAVLINFSAFILLVFSLGIWDRNMAKDYIKQIMPGK
jgi:O-antigen/teichoic acid export membrane protein